MSDAGFPHLLIRASAGSGKTHQLTNRYLGLLAAGVEPDAILATTFTRKAAGEILDRVLWRLAEAAADERAARDLAEQVGAVKLTRRDVIGLLRRLIHSLHRVRISTLDSFYMALAGSFSLELGLPAGWLICEETDDAALRRQAVNRLLERDAADIFITLYRRLTRGETKRSIDGEFLDIVDKLYALHQETTDDAWQKLSVAPALAADKLNALIARIETFDLSKHAGMTAPRRDDLERVRQAAWEDLLKKGLCGKIFIGENAFRNKSIPEDLVALYGQLLEHVRAVMIAPIAEQTKATREFLERFHGELWTLKQSAGGMRFDDVTQTLVRALSRETLKTEALAFRLDGAIEHLLLDEFQDTSLGQWRVLEPLARVIVNSPPAGRTGKGGLRSFFCVGDLKQAVYRWRGGMAEIFLGLPRFLAKLEESPLDASRRSAPPIIETVNRVFENLANFPAGEKCQPGLRAWTERFAPHTTTEQGIPGFVCLCTGPEQTQEQGLTEQRGQHIEHVAKEIQTLFAAAPGCSIGVLCRKNETVARMIYELRRLEIQASEEGGNPLTDSPAVELLLSLFTLADHPGDTVAWFHLKNSPLDEQLRSFTESDHLAQRLRQQILAEGIGKVTHTWAQMLAPHCNQRDLSRLQQLIEAAYDFQGRSTLRADDFVHWVRLQRVPDPSSANVRIMTIHGAKGLQFHAVVLPELDSELIGRMKPSFVVDRDPDSLAVNFVCRYASETVQELLTAKERRAFEHDRSQRVEESLSLLYVAMTRAIHALYMYIPGKRLRNQNDTWHNLLVKTLNPKIEAPADKSVVYERGDRQWYATLARPAAAVVASASGPQPIVFRAAGNERRRGLDQIAPSRREGHARVPLKRLFRPSEGTGMAAGTLYHAWFETIAWLEDGEPTAAALRAAAQKKRWDLPAETWRDLDRLLAQFQAWLRDPQVTSILRRTAYAGPKQLGFPLKLAPLWTTMFRPHQVERERRFLIRDGKQFWNGSFDRVVWLSDGSGAVAADVIDFKTDAIQPGDKKALTERTEHYRPQLDAYRHALARMANLPEERVAMRLVFTFPGRVVEL
jgi:ATP-dependent helicase/nuclease subunit A